MTPDLIRIPTIEDVSRRTFITGALASAFLIAPATMGQRLVRAKHKIREAGIPFRVPERAELPDRLDAALEAIYVAFAEGWSDPAGTEVRRRNLAEEALWLGRLVASLLPDEPEALGLLALMLHAEARRPARRSPRGAYVPLAEQDPALWDTPMIEEAEALLSHAGAMDAIGRYQLEAAVQSAHVVRRRTGRPDWPAIERLYDALFALTGSPVVAINRAIAVLNCIWRMSIVTCLIVLCSVRFCSRVAATFCTDSFSFSSSALSSTISRHARSRKPRTPTTPAVLQGFTASSGPMNISNSRSESAPNSRTTSSGFTTLPRAFDIFSPFSPRIIPWFTSFWNGSGVLT